MAIVLLDHIDEFLAVVHFHEAEKMAQERNDCIHTGLNPFLGLLAAHLDPVHLMVLSQADQTF